MTLDGHDVPACVTRLVPAAIQVLMHFFMISKHASRFVCNWFVIMFQQFNQLDLFDNLKDQI